MWSSNKLTRAFLDFFKEKGHRIIESSSLIPEDDKTLLFTSAGMVPFKPFWAGEIPLEYKRATSIQKCLRLSDLDEVGKTCWHDTFFEMLGNFSFGDYFKEETIKWAWEFLINVLGINQDKLYISVYPEDADSFKIWKELIGIPENRIIKHPDNFWAPAGGKGACGPDTEIFYDLGEKFGDCEFDGECDRYIEFWNLVFPQFDQREEGKVPLKNRGVDTGMGLERLTMIMQEKPSIFETDLFYPLIRETEKISGKRYTSSNQIFNIIADHTRSLVCAIADGVYPSNEGRGYVLRRLLRRAHTRAREIGIEEPFIHNLVPIVSSIMGERYPYLKEKLEQISLIIKSEEEHFLKTLNEGISILNQVIETTIKEQRETISGKDAFKLYDTYGFPLSLTEEIAKEKKLAIDRDGFDKEMRKQKERARSQKKFEAIKREEWKIITEEESTFVGYTEEETKTKVIAYRIVDDQYEIILKKTPFYAEQGGQVGDTGELLGNDWKMQVEDTIPSPLGNIHKGKIEGKVKPTSVHAIIDKERHLSIKRNHTTTHILQRVLRDTLGEWVRQEGSLVAPDHFRFDFTHPKPLEVEEIERIEQEVNRVITTELPVITEILPYEEALEKGAIALFEEQYGKDVRMVSIDDFSRELCGGIHLDNTVKAGLFKITSETGVASGVRRIEAVTGWYAYKWARRIEQLLQQLEFLLEVDRDSLPIRLEKTLELIKEQKREIDRLESRITEIEIERLIKNTININGYRCIADVIEGSKGALRKLADELRDRLKEGAGLLSTKINSSVFVVTFVGDGLINRLNAGNLAREASRIVGGSGGGRADKGEGGGNKIEKMQEMVKEFPEIIRKYLKG